MQLPNVALEYRSTRTEAYAFVDKQNGQKREGWTITHAFEASDGTVYSLRQSAPAGVLQKDYKPELKKGVVYVVTLKSFELDKGLVRGSLESAISSKL